MSDSDDPMNFFNINKKKKKVQIALDFFYVCILAAGGSSEDLE